MNRGSMTTGYAGSTATDGFNEAPIHESGKCGQAPPEAGKAQWLQ